jgi:hypothetical protein
MAKSAEQQSPAQALIPFTGYYTLDAASGSFVSVDTNSIRFGAEEIQYAAAITISSDGQTSEQYPLGPNCTFDGGCLKITDPDGSTIADLAFSEEGGQCSVNGNIRGAAVTGSTPFGPIPPSIWAGTYYRQGQPVQHGGLLQYPYAAMLQIEADGTVLFAADGGELQPVPSYWYDYGMFVVGFTPAPQTRSWLFEMGTSAGWGRVAGNATDGSMLVSIRLQQPAPHL